MLALLVAAPSASLVASSSVASRPFLPANGAARAAMLQLCQPLPDTPADQVIDELLAESKPEALPALLGRRLDVLTDAGFLPRLEARRSASVAEYEQLQLEQLADLVVTFLEEVAERVQELEPKLAAANEEAEASIAEAAQQAQTARMDSTSMPARRARSSAGPSPTTSSSPPAARDGPEGDDDEEKREQRARNRFMVERLLDAANAGGDRLDTMLSENRDRLDASFFAHLQWEVEEQKQMKNRKLLAVLETVVQRACVEVESGQPEVALLSSVLQTQTGSMRMELYQRSLVPAAPSVQRAFLALVLDTQLALEKKVFRGEQVDPSLLQMLRVVSAEASDLPLASADEGEMGT